MLFMQGAQVQFLVRELDPIKSPHVTTETWSSQMNNYVILKTERGVVKQMTVYLYNGLQSCCQKY